MFEEFPSVPFELNEHDLLNLSIGWNLSPLEFSFFLRSPRPFIYVFRGLFDNVKSFAFAIPFYL